MTRSSLSRNAEKMRPHWVEWLTGLVATLLVLATIGWLVFEAISTDERPPEFSARVLTIEPVPSGWRVMVEVRNRADQAAAAVLVKGSLMDATTTIEDVEVTFDYIAGGSTTRGGLFFVNDPSRYRMQIVPTSFTEP